MAEEITKNLVYLTENLSNIRKILVHCVQDEIITRDDKERIMAEVTSSDKNIRFFDELMKKDWEEIKASIIKVFRETSNGHCADKIEGIETSHIKSKRLCEMHLAHLPVQISNTKKRKIKTILDSKWWPEEKRLPKAFFERKEYDNKLIDVLKKYLAESKNKSTVISQGAAVSGMGGVGKTTVAKWFAIHFHDNYNHIIWIDSGEDNLSYSFTDLGRKLKMDTSMRLKTLARECFSKLEKVKCLLIFDNAECYQGDQGIRDILPKHENFHTIITSRTKEWGSESGDGKIPEMHLTAFPTRESVEFLMLNLKDKLYTKGQLEELSELLGNLPLSLQIAVTAINTKKLSIEEYIKRIKETDHFINLNFDDYEKTINKTMKISLDIIKNLEKDPKQISYKILLIMGYIKPDFVPFILFRAIENLLEFEIKEAVEMLEKYSLVTIDSDCIEKEQSCSIHRLLQQVIRHNDQENAKDTLKKILSVEGFLDYKLLPYLYADEETQNLFPKVRARLVDQGKLEEFLEQRKFSEAVEISRMIKDTLKTPMAVYNYAVCLEKIDGLTEAVSVLRELHSCLVSETITSRYILKYISFNELIRRALIKINHNINENGLWNLAEEIEPEIVRGFLFLIYKRLRMDDAAHEIINQDWQLIPFNTLQSLDYILKFLKRPTIGGYRLGSGHNFIVLRLGNSYGKKISLQSCSLSEELPNDLDHLSLKNVEILNGDGRPISYYDINIYISHNMKSFTITGFNTTKFAIQINNLHSCNFISLEDCTILVQKGRRITPTEIDLRRVSFIQNGKEIETVCLNDLIDFQQIKKLTLHGNNMSMISDESLNMSEVFLRDFENLDFKCVNWQVGILTIKDTDVPLLLDNNTALRVNILHLENCSVHLRSLFFLSKSANEIKLQKVTVEIDQYCMERNMGICAAEVFLSEIVLIQDSVEVTDIPINKILDLTKIKNLTVDLMKDSTFDVNQQFSLDCLYLGRVKLINWDKSISSVKILKLWSVDIHDILSSQFRVTETLEIRHSVVDVTFLENISAAANKIVLKRTSIHLDTDLDTNNPSPKSHRINGQVKEIELEGITIFKDGAKIENSLLNEFINISQLRSLTLHTGNKIIFFKPPSRFTLDMENLSMSLDFLSLEDVTVIHWDKGTGHVDRMELIGIPFIKRNKIKISSLEFKDSSIDLSCLPENIHRIELYKNSVVTCQDQVPFNDLNCVILHRNHYELKSFARCPHLTKVELGYSEDEEFLPTDNLQWIPKTTKKLKLNAKNYSPTSPFTITGTGNCRFKLETLILEFFSLSQIESALEVLQPENVIFHRHIEMLSGSVTQAEHDVIKLIESYKSVAIGEFGWESDEDFQNCPLSKFAEESGKFYIFENQRGRVIQEAEFKEMMTL